MTRAPTGSGPASPSLPRVGGRAVVFTGVLCFLLGGTILRQGLDVHEVGGISLSLLPRWRMFSSVGLGLTQVRYVEVRPDGSRAEVDRFTVLGSTLVEQPKGIWRVHGRDQAVALGRRLCRALPAGTELRLEARTAGRKGWRVERGLDEDLCADGGK